MIAVIVLVLTSACVGAVIVRAIAPRAAGAIILSCGVLIGTALPGVILFLLSVLRIPWSLPAMVIGTLAVAGVGFAIGRDRLGRESTGSNRFSPLALIIDAATVLLLIGYAVFASTAPPAEADFVSIWGAKGRLFLHAGAIDFDFLDSASNLFTHPDYPVLLPLIFDSVALASGFWNAEGLGLLYVAWCAAVLLLIRYLLHEESGSAVFAAVGTLALLPAAASPYLGLGEGPLIAFGTAGVLLVRRGLREESRAWLLLGAVLLGLASQIKNEGLALVIAVLLAVMLTSAGRWKTLQGLWPAVVIPIPWLILRAIHSLPTDLAESGVLARMWLHVQQPAQMLEAVRRYPLGNPLFWLGVILAAALIFRDALTRERFALAALAFQYLFFLGAYLATPHSIDWHFKWSWERVVGQLTLLLAFIVVTRLAPLLTDRMRTA